MEETKVIYYIDDEETPYLVKLPVATDKVTLADFKNVLNRDRLSYKFFFKSQDDDFGVVKEEVLDDDARLPLFNGRVVSWLVSAEGSMVSEGTVDDLPPGIERGHGVGETRPPSFHGGPGRTDHRILVDDMTVTESESMMSRQEGEDLFDDTESSITSVSQAARDRRRMEQRMRRHGGYNGYNGMNGGHKLRSGTTETSSMMSSEIESSLYDTEDAQSMASSRFTTSTDQTSVSRNMMRQRQRRRVKRKVPEHLARAGSISSITDSTMSLNIITVTLNMDTVNFLGISIVGQSNKNGDGDCGIYVGSIMKGGAVALDGRIEPGDMILQVNDVSFENMSNDDAVRVLREVVQKPGPIKLVVAKCWDASPKGYLTLPRAEPVRPIDPGAWVAHTAAVRGEMPLMPPSHFGPIYNMGDFPGRAPSVTTLSASSIVSSHADTEKFIPNDPLTINSGMAAIVRAMIQPDSGLEVRDRLWLKIKISNAFIGSDVVEWLFNHVQGFQDRREARKYATQMLKAGFIKHSVDKTSFSEQCYYTFGEEVGLAGSLASLKIKDPAPPPTGHFPTDHTHLGTLGPLPPPGGPGGPGGVWTGPDQPAWINAESGPGWSSGSGYGGTVYNPAPPPSAAPNYMAMPYGTYGGSGDGMQQTYNYQQQPSLVSSGGSGSSQPSQKLRLAGSGSGSESEGRGSTIGSDTGGFRTNQGLTVNSFRTTSHSQENLGTFQPPIQQPVYQA